MTKKNDPVETGKAKAQSTASAAKEHAKSAQAEARHMARDASEKVRERAESEAGAAREAVADSVDSVAETFYEASEKMTDGSPQAEAADRIGSTVSGAAQSLRDTDLGTLGQSVTQAARRHPVAFAGVAALAGFAVGRFLKATSPDHGAGMGGSHGGAYRGSPSSDFDRPDYGASGSSYGSAPVARDAAMPTTPPQSRVNPASATSRLVHTPTEAASRSRPESDASTRADLHTPGRGSA